MPKPKKKKSKTVAPADTAHLGTTIQTDSACHVLESNSSQPPGGAPISALALCGLTGLTDRRHRQLAENGYFRPPVRGTYGPDAIPGLFKYLRELIAKKNEKLAQEQFLLTKAKRETAQEELANTRKLYVLRSEIGPALRNVSLNQRALLQQKLERELAPNLAGLTTPEIIVRMTAAVDAICGLFRDGTKAWIESSIAAPVPESVKDGK